MLVIVETICLKDHQHLPSNLICNLLIGNIFFIFLIWRIFPSHINILSLNDNYLNWNENNLMTWFIFSNLSYYNTYEVRSRVSNLVILHIRIVIFTCNFSICLVFIWYMHTWNMEHCIWMFQQYTLWFTTCCD